MIFDWLEQCLLHIPIVLLCADRELEIFARYAVPVLESGVSLECNMCEDGS